MAKAAKKDVQVSLETVLWNCRVALRGIAQSNMIREIYERSFMRYVKKIPPV